MSTYSHFSQENDLEVFTNINSINPIDPDGGEGDTPVDLSRRVDAVFKYVPTDTAEYTDPIRPGLQSKINFLYDYWLPEDVVVRDIYGGESSQNLSINLAPLSHAPECDDVNCNWPRTPSGAPVSYLEGELSFRDADMAYDPDESLSLNINGTTVTEETSVAGQYGSLTINPDGSFSYTTELIGEDLLEDFTYTVTDAAGNSAEAHLYIRLSDDAPVFPNTGDTEEGIVTLDTDAGLFAGLNLFSTDEHALYGADAPVDVPAAGDGAMDAPSYMPPEVSAMSDPVEVTLASVPLPYDADALQQAGR